MSRATPPVDLAAKVRAGVEAPAGVRRPPWRGDAALAAALAGAAALVGLVAAAALLREDFPRLLFPLALGIALIGLVRPLVACAAAVVMTPSFGWVLTGPETSVFQILVAAAAVGTLIACRRQLRPLAGRLARIPAVALATGFVAWTAGAAAVNAGASDLGYLRNYAGALVLLLVVAVLARTPDDRRVLVGALLVGVAATAVVGLAQVVSMDALVGAWVLPGLREFQDTYTRLASPWGLATIGSEYSKDVLVGLAVVVPLGAAARGRYRWPAAALALVLVIALAVSGSRSAWLAGIVAMLYLAFVVRGARLRIAVLAVAALLGVLIIRPTTPTDAQGLIGLDAPAFTDRTGGGGGGGAPVAGVRDAASTEVSNRFRARLNRAGVRMALDHPVAGVGPGAFRDRVDAYIDRSPAAGYGELPERLPPHNVYIGAWAELGTPGALLYVGFLAAILAGLERRRRRGDPGRALAVALSAGLLALLVTSAFHNYQYDNLLWLMAALAVSLDAWREDAPAPPG